MTSASSSEPFPQGYVGAAFRQCHPDHTDFAATVRASLHREFRFNPAGEFGVLYVALSPSTARAELERQASRLGVPLSRMAPRLMLHLDVALERVLDLADAQVRAGWSLSLDELSSDDYTRCHEIAREARAAGYEAIRYPSATGEGENLAIFFDRLSPASRVRIAHHEILPLGE
jgi:RES domain-containing protein